MSWASTQPGSLRYTEAHTCLDLHIDGQYQHCWLVHNKTRNMWAFITAHMELPPLSTTWHTTSQDAINEAIALLVANKIGGD